jgi:hypothetical protein
MTQTARTGGRLTTANAARNAPICNPLEPLELVQGPRACTRGGDRRGRFGNAETGHIERDTGVTSNSVAFSAGPMSAVAIWSIHGAGRA